MKLEFTNPTPTHARANFLVTKCAEIYFPKQGGSRNTSRNGSIDGVPTEFRVTSSGNWKEANSGPGQNAYFKLNGTVYWICFDSGFDATKADLTFKSSDGVGVKNPVRLPIDPAKEVERRKLLSERLKARFSKPEVAAPESEDTKGETTTLEVASLEEHLGENPDNKEHYEDGPEVIKEVKLTKAQRRALKNQPQA
jgi:hypothetical protein